MKKALILFSFLLGCQYVVAQVDTLKINHKPWLKNQPDGTTNATLPKPKVQPAATKDMLRKNAATDINLLKNGILLVRLRTGDLAVSKLIASGQEDLASSIREQQRAINQRLVSAFRKNYTFSPVYFFYSSATENVMEGQAAGIFLNDQLEPDPTISLPDLPVFIAEITDIEQFRANPEQVNYNPEISFRALVLRDSKFHQLADPFPYYIKATTIFPPHRRTEAELVTILDKKLKEFYSKTVAPVTR